MIAELGIITTSLAFAAAVYALVAALFGARTRRDRWVVSARNAALSTFPLLTTACVGMLYALHTHDYSIRYVSETTDNATPTFYLYTALWGGQAGSLLFWSWLMSAFTFAALLMSWRSERRLMPFVIVGTMATLGFFLSLNVFFENPFVRFWEVPGSRFLKEALFAPSGGTAYTLADGNGLNPLLRHFGMAIHPPLLYLGYVGFTIPFAFAFAALATGQLGSGWIRATRAWALLAWMFLSMGLLLGGRWAYDVLGWGGYWGWDPVENAALLPWLTGTAFLHSAVVQEKRGMLKFWNMLLIIMTFILVVLGTFATRSGVISSVHAFAQSQVGRPMFAFLGITMLTSLALLGWRQGRGDLRGADQLDSFFSRESFFLLNNWMFLGLTVVVLWGTWAEAITTIMKDLGLRSTVINLGRDYYPPVVRPFLLGIFILMGIAPLAAWRRATAERLGRALFIPSILAVALMAILALTGMDNIWALLGYGLIIFAGTATLTEIWKGVAARHGRGEGYWTAFSSLVARDRHRYGGYFIHLGMVVLGLGVIGSSGFQQTTQQPITDANRRIELGPYTIVHNKLFDAQASDGRTMVIAEADVFRGDKKVAQIRPRRDIFYELDATGRPVIDPGTGQQIVTTNMSIAGTYSTLEGDLYTIIYLKQGSLIYSVYWNPLINFVWIGGLMLVLSTLVALWPARKPAPVAQTAPAPGGIGKAQAGGD